MGVGRVRRCDGEGETGADEVGRSVHATRAGITVRGPSASAAATRAERERLGRDGSDGHMTAARGKEAEACAWLFIPRAATTES